MSVKSNPAAADYLDITVTQGEKQKKRANSIHTFEVPKQYRRNPELVRAARKKQQERERLAQEKGIPVDQLEVEEEEKAVSENSVRSMVTAPRKEVFTLDFAIENAW